MTALHTGMRKSELFNLKWSDIDFEQQYQRLIEKDIANVRENVHKDLFAKPLDKKADTLKQENMDFCSLICIWQRLCIPLWTLEVLLLTVNEEQLFFLIDRHSLV